MDDDDLMIAGLCLELGRPREARRILAVLLDADPADPVALRLMARACLDQNATRAALEWARKSVEIDPDDDWGWRLVSAAASANRDYDEARAASTRARELAPEVWLNHAQRVQVDLNATVWTVTDETWDAAHEAMRLAPEEPGAFLVGASLARSRGFLDGAASFAQEALRLDPDNEAAKHFLATIRLESNDMAGATVSFLELADEAPGSRRRATGLRRAVLRTLEWVNGILLVALLVIGLLAIIDYTTPSSAGVDRALIALTLVLALGGLGLAWRAYRRGLGEHSRDLFLRLRSVAPSLVVLVGLQAAILLAMVVLVIALVVAAGPLGAVLAIAAIGAAGLMFASLAYAGVLHMAY